MGTQTQLRLNKKMALHSYRRLLFRCFSVLRVVPASPIRTPGRTRFTVKRFPLERLRPIMRPTAGNIGSTSCTDPHLLLSRTATTRQIGLVWIRRSVIFQNGDGMESATAEARLI